jgi:hypothetical protein
MRRRLRGSLWLLLCIALASLFPLQCSSATSFSSKLRDWLGRGGEVDDGDGGEQTWPRRLFSSLSKPRPKSTTPPLRVWIDSFGLAKGEATIMLEEIEVLEKNRGRSGIVDAAGEGEKNRKEAKLIIIIMIKKRKKTFPVLARPVLARRQPRLEVFPEPQGILRSRCVGLPVQRQGDVRAGEGGAELVFFFFVVFVGDFVFVFVVVFGGGK